MHFMQLLGKAHGDICWDHNSLVDVTESVYNVEEQGNGPMTAGRTNKPGATFSVMTQVMTRLNIIFLPFTISLSQVYSFLPQYMCCHLCIQVPQHLDSISHSSSHLLLIVQLISHVILTSAPHLSLTWENVHGSIVNI